MVEFLLSTVLMRLIYLDKPSALSSGRLEPCSVDILYTFFFFYFLVKKIKKKKKGSVFYPGRLCRSSTIKNLRATGGRNLVLRVELSLCHTYKLAID